MEKSYKMQQKDSDRFKKFPSWFARVFFRFQLREVATAPHLGDFSSEEKALYDFLFSSEYRRRRGMSLSGTNWTRLISFCSVPSVIDIKPYRDYSMYSSRQME